ncbi:NAD(P)-dependent dehydrogenase (short-subunit alcohol dehydrogenase family) [Kribbella amoyensis]|uniref:NAD(P)-dependent dehydrogenase (Short-subunit alcohol dehydrogenase family) n=1 Tax=Kribbella amoyensis TaxID=996641 RepID=A0A561BN80_9ACTN|nr:SDR family oxidoreductase [Kribbella amoyensis]TWD80307.1 NAD(P)-dependent dehydrogenase (short-subunit alcohol dehydrogenase family) [Kribbella amoyensis]
MSRGVLVTGASRGVGAEVAKVFAAGGDRVVLHCRGAVDKAEAVRRELPGEGHAVVAADLGDADAIPSLVEESVAALGRIDVLVNNAALFVDDPVAGSRRIGHPLAETSYEDWVAAWRRTLAVNLEGAAHLTWCVARQMLDTDPAEGVRRGAIVNVGSRGAYRGEPDVSAYGASKAGLHAFGQSMAVSLAPHDITVTSIAPGFIATDMVAQGLDGPGGDAIRAQSPFGRVATADEVAAAIHWLAAPGSGWSSGAVLDFNGASYLR